MRSRPPPRWPLVIAVVMLSLLASASLAEESGGDDAFGVADAEEAGDAGGAGEGFGVMSEDDAGADAVATTQQADGPEPVVNSFWIGEVEAYAKQRGLAITRHGDGRFRFMAVGGNRTPEPQELIKLGETALTGMEIWSGRQNLFVPAEPADELAYWIVVFAENGQVDGFIDHMRSKGRAENEEGEDLSKKLHQQWGARCWCVAAPTFNRIARNWTAHIAVGLALKTFYARHDREPSKWLRAGLAAEMERLLCQRILITVINYENQSANSLSHDWIRDMKMLIREGREHLMTASEVTHLDLVQTPAEHYRQLWSLATFLQAAGAGKGADNRFAEYLRATAKGSSELKAIQRIYGWVEPKFTRAWHKWANDRR